MGGIKEVSCLFGDSTNDFDVIEITIPIMTQILTAVAKRAQHHFFIGPFLVLKSVSGKHRICFFSCSICTAVAWMMIGSLGDVLSVTTYASIC